MDIESQNWILTTSALKTCDLRDELVLWTLAGCSTGMLLWTLLLLWVLVLVVALLSLLVLALSICVLPRNMLLWLRGRRGVCGLRTRIVAVVRSFVLSVRGGGAGETTVRVVALITCRFLAGHAGRVRSLRGEGLAEAAVVLRRGDGRGTPGRGTGRVISVMKGRGVVHRCCCVELPWMMWGGWSGQC